LQAITRNIGRKQSVNTAEKSDIALIAKVQKYVNIRDLEAIAKNVKEEIFVSILYKKVHVEHAEEVDFALMIREKNNAKIATYHYIWSTFKDTI
jgi:hypothetical protein